jgi:hypothetical protein
VNHDEELLARLASLDPLGGHSAVEPPPFERVEGRIASAAEHGGMRRLLAWLRGSRAGLLACTAVLLGGGTAALAATGVFGSGSTIERVTGGKPNYELGVAQNTQSGLLALRVPDPAGGPAWGMRFIRTSRGFGCLEIGRIVHGRLGLLGIDDVGHDDHLFHPFAENSFSPEFCGQLDEDGHADINAAGSSYYAAGVPLTGYRCPLDGGSANNPSCPTADERELAFGLRGPDAQSVTYTADGRTRTERTVGPDGAYLIVLPVHGSHSLGTTFGSGPSEPVTAVTYRNGTVCPTRPQPGRPARSCTYEGFVLPKGPVLPAHYDARVHISVSNGVLSVTFRAPVATTNADTTYVLEARAVGCESGTTSATTRTDIRKGQQVTLTAAPNEGRAGPSGSCGKRIQARLGLATPTADPARDLAGPDMATEPTKGQVIKRFNVPTSPQPFTVRTSPP